MAGPWDLFASNAASPVAAPPAAPTGVADGPWALFGKIEPQPPRESPGVLGYAADIGEQAVRGFNKGLATVVTAPYRAVDWAAEKITGGQGLPDVETMPLWKQYLEQPDARTTPGRYAAKAGEVIGSSAVPVGAVMSQAPRLAAMAPTTTMGALGQTVGQNITAAPGAALALDVASGVSGGVAEQGVKEAGYGPAAQTVAGMVGSVIPGVAAYRAGVPGPVGTQTGRNIAQSRATSTADDIAAFDAQGVRQFGPAYNQGPVASVGKQLTETPFIGAPLRNNLDETYHDAAAAVARLADNVSPTATPETAGAALQSGLARFRNSGLKDLEASTVEQAGLPSSVQGPIRNIMSAGAEAQAAQAAPIRQAIGADTTQTTRGVTVPTARTREQTLTQRTSAADLSDEQLQQLVRMPATETSAATRAEALYERAWRTIPQMMRSNGSANPNLISPVNTRVALQQTDSEVASQIAGQGRIGGEVAARLRNPSAGITLNDLRAIRTEIGRAMSNWSPTAQNTLDKSQLRQLYAATSRDIEISLETLANRAAIGTARSNNAPNYVPPEVARQAAGALRAFRTADRYYRSTQESLDRFATVLNAQSPEAAARRVVQAATAGDKGNIQLVRSAMAGLRPDERSEVGAMLVRSLGQPNASARGIVQESGFSPSSFVTRYNNMSPEARSLMFTPEHQRSLDQLFRVANRLSNVEAMANTSRSGTNSMNMGGAIAGAGAVMTGDVLTPLAIGVSGAATSILMSTPAYTRWMAQYVGLRAAVRAGNDRTIGPLLRHVNSLGEQAKANPALMPAFYEVSSEVKDLTPKKKPDKRAEAILGRMASLDDTEASSLLQRVSKRLQAEGVA